jgi:hypothetical protein
MKIFTVAEARNFEVRQWVGLFLSATEAMEAVKAALDAVAEEDVGEIEWNSEESETNNRWGAEFDGTAYEILEQEFRN